MLANKPATPLIQQQALLTTARDAYATAVRLNLLFNEAGVAHEQVQGALQKIQAETLAAAASSTPGTLFRP